MNIVPPRPHPIDHLVLPTADLEVARARLSALGFTIAPVGVHPFGTTNCCVYLADGTFLEPLAVGNGDQAAAAVRDRNVFVARDRLYRERNGDEGFSALVLGTTDARADHAGFVEAGISAGEMLAFSRPFVDAAGNADTASFLLAFAAEEASSDCFFFTCERVNAPAVDRAALQRHENGASRITRVVLSSAKPTGHLAFLERAMGSQSRAATGGLELAAANGVVSVLDATALRDQFAIQNLGDGLLLRAIVFAVADLAALEALFAPRGVAFATHDGRLIVPPAPGQGAHFIFEANT